MNSTHKSFASFWRSYRSIVFAVLSALLSFGMLPVYASTPSACKVLTSNDQGIELEFTLGTIEALEVRNDQGVFSALFIPEGYLSRNIGSPALPTTRHLISLPYGAKPSVQVMDVQQEDIPLAALGMEHPVYPAQPPYPKSAKPEDIKFIMHPALYAKDAFIGDELAIVDKRGTMRGVGVGGLVISPVQYNPVSKTLRVTRKCRIIVEFKDSNKSAKSIRAKEYSPAFNKAYKTFLNPPDLVTSDEPASKESDSSLEPGTTEPETPSSVSDAPDSKAWPGRPDLVVHPVTYLIVASDQLQGNAKLNEFIEWKKQKGFTVIDHYVSALAAITEVDAWIENQYNTLTVKPSFLLIVGDESGTYCVKTEVNPPLGYYLTDWYVTRSDLLYGVIGSVTTANYIPSMHVGRFSVRSTAELTAQVDKTIWYEKGQFEVATPDLNYLTKPLGAAGYDTSYGPNYGNPQIAYGWNHYFNTANGMTGAVHYLHDTAYTKAADIIARVSAGVNFYNYTAHGWENGFADPSFTVSNVNGLTNANRYPLVVGNCCLTGSFGTIECFGESWLNRANGGGIGYIGASMNTTWAEDLAMGAGTASIIGNDNPPLSQNLPGMYDGRMMEDYPSQGATRFCGLLAVENYGGMRKQYWSAYHLFGDPSLCVYFGIPDSMTVVHASDMIAGATNFAVSVPGLANAVCALYDPATKTLHGVAETDGSGEAIIPLDPAPPISANLTLTVTKVQKRPYQAIIPVTGRSISFAQSSYSVSETGQTVRLSVTRSGDSSGAASVDYTTVNDTASAGSDYISASGTLHWADGSSATNHIDITILNDSVYSGNLAFRVLLNNVTTGISLGYSNVTVTIQEDEIMPSIPAGLTAAPSVGQVALSWNPSSNATGYNVKRAVLSGGSYTTIASPASPSYTDNAVTHGETYYYVISALNNTLESANSVEVSATLPQAVPFLETFDGSCMSSAAGVIGGQRGWQGGTGALVVPDTGRGGTQALQVNSDQAGITFQNGSNKVYLSMWMKAVGGDDPLGGATVGTSASAVFWIDTNNFVRAYSNQTIIALPIQVNPSEYTHFEAYLDYAAGTWRLDVNGTTAFNAFGTYSTQPKFAGVLLKNTSAETAYYEDISIASGDQPLSAYQEWLLVNGCDGDTPGDATAPNGVNTFMQSYIAGLNPSDPNSLFKINDAEVQGNYPVLDWQGVSGRLYNIYWTTNIMDGFSIWQSNVPWHSSIVTDTVHSTEHKGFYRIDAQMEN